MTREKEIDPKLVQIRKLFNIWNLKRKGKMCNDFADFFMEFLFFVLNFEIEAKVKEWIII